MTQTISTEQLWDETLRLTAEIEELQARLEYLLDNEPEGAPDPECWNVWPYSWAIAGWNTARERFHSFHEKRAVRAAGYERPLESGCPLRLV